MQGVDGEGERLCGKVTESVRERERELHRQSETDTLGGRRGATDFECDFETLSTTTTVVEVRRRSLAWPSSYM